MENKVIKINDDELDVKEINGQRVVTLRDIDRLHKRPKGTASRNFCQNRQRFIENEDYFIIDITEGEIRTRLGVAKNAGRELTLITESGYLILVKSLTDDLAWDVQRKLLNTYFKAKEFSQTQADSASAVDNIYRRLTDMDSTLQLIRYQMFKTQPTTKYRSKWKTKVNPKLDLLSEHFNVSKFKVLSNLYMLMEDEYNIDLNSYRNEYCLFSGNETCTTLDIIDDICELREMFDSTIDGLLGKYGFATATAPVKRENIFV